jgi:hypothetical protein
MGGMQHVYEATLKEAMLQEARSMYITRYLEYTV